MVDLRAVTFKTVDGPSEAGLLEQLASVKRDALAYNERTQFLDTKLAAEPDAFFGVIVWTGTGVASRQVQSLSRTGYVELEELIAGVELVITNFIVVSEEGVILAELEVEALSRTGQVFIEQLIQGAMVDAVHKVLVIDESGNIITSLGVEASARNAFVKIEQLIKGTMVDAVHKRIILDEAGNAIAVLTIEAQDRNAVALIEQLIKGTEGVVVTQVPADPGTPTVTVTSSGVLEVTADVGSTTNATHYDIRFRKSTDGATWGAWTERLNVGTGAEVIACNEAEWVEVEARARNVTADGTTKIGAWSAPDSAQSDTRTPGAPSGVGFDWSQGSSFHDDTVWLNAISWTANADGLATRYRVERTSPSATLVGTPTTTSINDTALDTLEGKSFDYKVRAERVVNGQLAVSSYVATGPTRIPLESPSGLSITSTGTTSLGFSWTNQSEEDSHVRVYLNGAFHHSVAATATSSSIGSLSPDTSYTIEVRAFNSTTGAISSTGVTEVTGKTDMTAPSNLVVGDSSVCVNGTVDTSADLTWDAGTTNSAWKTVIQRESPSAGSGTYVDYAEVDASVQQYTDPTPEEGIGYRVYHERDDGTDATAKSNTDTWNQSAGVCPTSPSHPQLSAADGSQCVSGSPDYEVDLSWTAKAGWDVRIEYEENDSGTWTAVGVFGSATSSTVHDIAAMGEGDKFEYRARYQQPGSTGAYGGIVAVTLANPCKPEPVINYNLTAISGDVTVNWDTQDRTESVRVRLFQNDVEVENVIVDTAPNTAGYSRSFVYFSGSFYAVLTPYSADAGGGDPGPARTTNTATI